MAGAALLATLPSAVRAESLADAVVKAYRTNPTLAANRYDVRQADEGVAQAQAELRPTVDLQANLDFDHSVLGRPSRSPFNPTVSNSNSERTVLTVNQPLYTGGRATADRVGAIATVSAQRAALRGAEGDLLLAVITDYVDVRRYAAELEVWRGSVLELERIEKEIEARQQAGELTLTDVAQARNQLGQAREQAVATEEALESARADYEAVVGHAPGTLDPEPSLPRLPGSADQAFIDAAQESPELSRSLYIERASRADIASARAAGAGTVSLRGTGTLNGEAFPYRYANQDRALTGSVVFSIPLSAGGRIASQVRQAEDRNAQDRVRIEAARRQLMRDVTNAWNAMVTADRAAILIGNRRATAMIQLEGMLAEYRVGLRTTFDVLYAQQSLRDSQVSLLSAERERYVSAATLLRRTGSLEVARLTSGVPRYDPAPHLSRVEKIGATPWDGAVAAVDGVLPVRGRTPAIRQPDVSTAPRILPASPPPPDRSLARAAPTTPVLGTVGSPAPGTRP
jgi:outer membrane protein